MPKFKDLKSLETYLQKNIQQVMNKSAELERALAETMSSAVFDVVYKSHEPEQYVRRGDEGGLSDTRNMEIVSVEVVNGGVQLVFENLTEGVDNLKGKFITDTIVEGIKENWNYAGSPYSDPRDFVAETAKRLRDNPTELAQALRNGLISKGFIVK